MKKLDKESVKDVYGKSKGFFEEFKTFILRGNVMDMAVGVIIGGAFSSLVTALTKDFINPLINSIGGAEVNGKIKIWGGQYLDWGDFVTSVINFLIMAFVLFILLKTFNKLTSIKIKKEKKEEVKEEKVKSDETLLLEEIRDLLKKQK